MKLSANITRKVNGIVVKDALQNQIEAGLNALLASLFPNKLKDAFLPFNEGGVYDVWLEPIELIESDAVSANEVRSALEAYLKLFGAKLGLVQLTASESEIPTFGQILRAAKRLSPVQVDTLFNALKAAGFKVPTRSWIVRKLDTLRKRQLLIRFKDGRYSLTGSGLATVPHDKTRTSCRGAPLELHFPSKSCNSSSSLMARAKSTRPPPAKAPSALGFDEKREQLLSGFSDPNEPPHNPRHSWAKVAARK